MTRSVVAVACLALGAAEARAQVFFGPPPGPAWGPPALPGGFKATGRMAVPGFWGPLPPPPPAALWASPLYDPWALPPGWWEPPRVVVVVPPPVVVVRPPAMVAAPPVFVAEDPAAPAHVGDAVRRGELTPVTPKKAAPADREKLPAPKPLPPSEPRIEPIP